MVGKSLPTRSQLRYEMRNIYVQYPRLYLPLARLRHSSELGSRAVDSDTDLVIEGYPRSANSFAFRAFTLAQSRPMRVAHQLHAPAQIIGAAKMGIPALLLIRDPEEAILSRTLLFGYPYDTVTPAMKEYLRFHEATLPYREHYLLATFDAVTSDFGAVIRALNRRFGTEFEEFEHTEENVKRCFDLMEQRNRQIRGSLNEVTVSRPSEERRALKESLRSRFRADSVADLRERVYGVYHTLMRQVDI